jgi:hypothetical protein
MVRVVTGEVPVRFVWFLPGSGCPDTFDPKRENPERRGMRLKAAWLAAGTRRGTLPFE